MRIITGIEVVVIVVAVRSRPSGLVVVAVVTFRSSVVVVGVVARMFHCAVSAQSETNGMEGSHVVPV
jgi:hypothetical protein